MSPDVIWMHIYYMYLLFFSMEIKLLTPVTRNVCNAKSQHSC